jgi:hypothetical protein
MAATKPSPRFQVGDRVKIRYSDWRARIVEFRGPLGPGGAFVYRVRVPHKPKPTYIELPEDELTAIPTRPKQKPSPSESQAPEAPGHQGDGPTLPKATTASIPLFRKGDRVKMRGSNWQGRIVELRIPSAPGRVYVYRVRVPAEPRSIYVELPENYLLAIPKPAKANSNLSAQRHVRDERKEK